MTVLFVTPLFSSVILLNSFDVLCVYLLEPVSLCLGDLVCREHLFSLGCCLLLVSTSATD